MKNNKKYSTGKLHTTNSQTGLSLIELLIAMFIGLFLLVGISTSYLSSKKSSITRDQVSLLEDNGRVALEILSNTLQHAGYRSTSLVALDTPFMSAGRPTSYSCGTGIASVEVPTDFPTTVINDSDLNGDSIGVVYMGDDYLNTDCGGSELPPECRVGSSVDPRAHQIYNAFFIDNNDTLQCAGSRSSSLMTIAEGVENIQILYGINADNDTTKSVDRYVNATDVAGNWNNVVSIQIAILVRTLLEVKPEPESQTFTLLNTRIPTVTDRYQRAVFSTSINLRNL